MIEEKGLWLQAQDSSCDLTKKPNVSELCNNGPCKPEWYMSEWSRVCNRKYWIKFFVKKFLLKCSKTCGDGIRTREIKCLDTKMQPSLECDLKTRPSYRDYCAKRECPKQTEAKSPDTKVISLSRRI